MSFWCRKNILLDGSRIVTTRVSDANLLDSVLQSCNNAATLTSAMNHFHFCVELSELIQLNQLAEQFVMSQAFQRFSNVTFDS